MEAEDGTLCVGQGFREREGSDGLATLTALPRLRCGLCRCLSGLHVHLAAGLPPTSRKHRTEVTPSSL